MASFVAIINLVCLVFVLAIPILLGVFIYRDASQRGMNAALWTLIVVFLSFIGLIIYLLERQNYADWQCPVCSAPVTKQYVVCPKCNTKLRASCSNCGCAAKADWMACPHCTSPLSEQNNGFVTPTKKKDTALVRILMLAIVAPILCVVLAGLFGIMSSQATLFTRAGVMDTQFLRVSDFQEHPEVNTWLSKCNEDKSRAYALRYQAENGRLKETHYLVYKPTENSIHLMTASDNASSSSRTILDAKFGENPGPALLDGLVYIYCYDYNYFADLWVFVNDEIVFCEITDVDYIPSPQTSMLKTGR